MERREQPRIRFPVLVTWRGDGIAGIESGYAHDLSIAGLGVEGASARVGAVLDLQLVTRDGRRPLEVLGEVVRADDTGFAVRFLDLEPAQAIWLGEVVARQAEAPPLETEDLLAAGFDD